MNRLIFSPLLVFSVLLQVVAASEKESRPLTAGQFAIQVASERPDELASTCVAEFPAMKSDFDQVIADYRATVGRIANRLLATSDFELLNHEPASRVLVDWYHEEKKSLKEKFKNVDSEPACRAFLRNLRFVDEKALEAAITKTLTGTKTIVMGEKAGGAK